MEKKMYFGIKAISISEHGITLKFQDELKIFLPDILLHRIAEKHNSPCGEDIGFRGVTKELSKFVFYNDTTDAEKTRAARVHGVV